MLWYRQVLAVFACFVALLVKAEPDWSDVFMGYIPNKALFQSGPNAVYTGKSKRTFLRPKD